MATTEEPSGDRRFPTLALIAVAIVHAPVLAGDLLDADRVLLVRNVELRSFAGLGTLIANGESIVRGTGLVVRNSAPLGVLSTWLGWQWFRASPLMQHAAGLVIALAIAAALASLLAPRNVLAAAAVLALMLHPCAADLTGPILGRDALLATWVTLLAARRARDASPRAAIAWSAAASLIAGAFAPGWGLLGLVAALMIAERRTRALAVTASIVAAIAALAIHRSDLARVAVADAVGQGAGAAFLAWIPSVHPFVTATVGEGGTAGLVPVIVLAPLALFAASRAPSERDAALIRAGAGALLAALFASAIALRDGTVTGAAAFALQLGVVLVVAGTWDSIVARCRPWMVGLFVIPAVMTFVRARAWADEDHVLAAIVARDDADPEAILAEARRALRRGKLDEALPSCMRYAAMAPEGRRADGCIAAAAVRDGDEAAAVVLLRRWASRFDDPRALRAAVLEIGEARPDPRFGEAFRRATGYNMPARRSGEP